MNRNLPQTFTAACAKTARIPARVSASGTCRVGSPHERAIGADSVIHLQGPAGRESNASQKRADPSGADDFSRNPLEVVAQNQLDCAVVVHAFSWDALEEPSEFACVVNQLVSSGGHLCAHGIRGAPLVPPFRTTSERGLSERHGVACP